MLSYFIVYVLGVVSAGGAVVFWPKVKAWFSNEEAAIATAVKAKI